MTFDIATVLCGSSRPSWPDQPQHIEDHQIIWSANQNNELSPCQCYQGILDMSRSDIIIYMHNDVTIHDPNWLYRIMHLFTGDTVAVGLGGAIALGNQDLYRKPYRINNLARRGYASNQIDAEVHGDRFTGVRRVAVLDAFCMAVRSDFLLSCGGWPVGHLTHHCLDLWLACEAARRGKEIWMIGASCTHHGGGASTSPIYKDAKWLQGGSREKDHELPHRWIADTYRDVLPIETGGNA